MVVAFFAFHPEDFGADLGTDFTTDALFLIDNGYAGHGIPPCGFRAAY
jgi:hypothetical protein